LKEKIRSEEINRDLSFKITEPIENYCAKHQHYQGIPVSTANSEPNINCVSKLGYITYTLTFWKGEMYK
jgi:hypothetical protein